MCPNEKTMWDHLACRNVNPKKRNLQECLQHYHAFFWLATISFLVYLRRCGLYTYTFVCVHSFIQQAFIECPLCVRHCVRWFWHSKVSQSGRKKKQQNSSAWFLRTSMTWLSNTTVFDYSPNNHLYSWKEGWSFCLLHTKFLLTSVLLFHLRRLLLF